MAEIIKMPKLSDTMTEGTVAEWHKKVGDTVKSGEVLAEIETDKATMEFESYQDGTLLYIGVEKGKAAAVDAVLAIIGKEGEDINDLLKQSSANGKEAAAPEAREEEKKPAEQSTPKPDQPQSAPSKTETSSNKSSVATAQKQPVKQQSPVSSDGRLKASPLAKKLATDKGIELGALSGTGDGGRVVKRDIENFSIGNMRPRKQEESWNEEPVSQMRKTIARRLSESMFTAPHFYLTMEIDMDAAVSARTTINENGGSKISFNDIVIKAVAVALRKNPKVNSSWLGDSIRYNDHVHIGVAIAVEEGLLVPVVRFADTKTLEEISAEVKQFAEKARNKKLQPQDWEGNTFTISNLGMFGIDEFTAIINPPDACILAIGGIRQVPVVKNGHVVPGNVMKVTLSCDHRVVDGATGAAFLQTLKANLENPILMFI